MQLNQTVRFYHLLFGDNSADNDGPQYGSGWAFGNVSTAEIEFAG